MLNTYLDQFSRVDIATRRDEGRRAVMNKSGIGKLVKNGVGVLALLSGPSALYACPMCYQAAAAGGGRFLEALRFGILVMLPLPFLLSGMIAYMAYRRRHHYIDSPDSLSPANPLMD